MRIGDLVQLSARGKKDKEVRRQFKEIHNSIGIITAISRGTGGYSGAPMYDVCWCATLREAWKHGVSWERYELKLAKEKKVLNVPTTLTSN